MEENPDFLIAMCKQLNSESPFKNNSDYMGRSIFPNTDKFFTNKFYFIFKEWLKSFSPLIKDNCDFLGSKRRTLTSISSSYVWRNG